LKSSMAASSRVFVSLALQTLNLICLGTVLVLDPLDVVDLAMITSVVAHHVVATALAAIAIVIDLLAGTIITKIAEAAVVAIDLLLALVDLLKTIHLPVAALPTKSLTVGTTLQLIHTSMVLLELMSVVPRVTTHLGMLAILVTTTVVTSS